MTVAQATVNIELALQQGWTQEEVEDRLNDLLAEMLTENRIVVSYDVTYVRVNADPFQVEQPKSFASGFSVVGNNSSNGVRSDYGNPLPLQFVQRRG